METEGKQDGPRFKDLYGMDEVLHEMKMLVSTIINREGVCAKKLKLPTGILLHGPPGCGKRALAHAIANELEFPFHHVSAGALLSNVPGVTLKNIQEVFSNAYGNAPCVLFIDDIEAIGSSEDIYVAQQGCMLLSGSLKSIMDRHREEAVEYVLVIGAASRAAALDSPLRAWGRFVEEYSIGLPDEDARLKILKKLTRGVTLDTPADTHLTEIAKDTPGWTGFDLNSLLETAGDFSAKRIAKASQESAENKDLVAGGSGGTVGNEDLEGGSVGKLEQDTNTITLPDLEKAWALQGYTREVVGGLPN